MFKYILVSFTNVRLINSDVYSLLYLLINKNVQSTQKDIFKIFKHTHIFKYAPKFIIWNNIISFLIFWKITIFTYCLGVGEMNN